jgi:peptidoglycan/LPS O-acetylase OafA/YrhL
VTNAEKPRVSGEWLDSWHVNPSLNKDYDVVDGLRGIAILLVIGCHLFYVNPRAGPALQFVGGVFAAGAWGVTVFFTLSGFLIAHPFWKRKSRDLAPITPPGYGWRRFWKIYPPLALSIVLLTPIYVARSGDASFIKTAGQWLVGWPVVVPVSGQLNPVMRSLILEVQFYLLLPLLFIFLKRASTKTCLWIVFLLLLLVPAGFRWWDISRGIYFAFHPEIRLHFPSLLDAFAFGVFLAGLDNLRTIKKSWAWFGDVGCVLLAASLPTMAWLNLHPIAAARIQTEILTWVVKLASVLMLCYIADPGHARARMLSSPWLRWCGLISYEWYLVHQPIALWARDSFGPAGGNVIKFGVIVGGSLVLGLIIAALVYRYFSLPILKYGRSRHSRP